MRNGRLVKADKDGKPIKCAFPPCQNHVHPNSQFGLCQTCEYIVKLVGWFDKAMEQVQKMREQGPAILVPKPGMEDKAIADALKKAAAQNQGGVIVVGNRKGG